MGGCFRKELVTAMEKQSEVLLKKITDMETKMNERIEGINQEMKKSNEKIKILEWKTNDIEMIWQRRIKSYRKN